MSKYSELADALVITCPNAGARTAPDVVTLIHAAAALRELEAERDRLASDLLYYGQHDGGCAVWHSHEPCDCGLTRALEGV